MKKPSIAAGFYRFFNGYVDARGKPRDITTKMGCGWREVYAESQGRNVKIIDWATGDRATIPVDVWIAARPEVSKPPMRRIIKWLASRIRTSRGNSKILRAAVEATRRSAT